MVAARWSVTKPLGELRSHDHNPVTFAFGPNYAFARTIVNVDARGSLSYTPTINYGGNDDRAALLGSNGLYYSVGNANNGNATTFGPNGTNPTSPRPPASRW